MEELRKRALAQHLSIEDDCIEDEIEVSGYDDCELEAEGGTYLVLTDDEADDKWDESLNNYIEECVMPEIPDNLQNYFDDDAWKEDAKHDGRGIRYLVMMVRKMKSRLMTRCSTFSEQTKE